MEPEQILNVPATAAMHTLLLLSLLLQLSKAASPPPGGTAPSSSPVPRHLPTASQPSPLLEKEARFCRAWSTETSCLPGLVSTSSSFHPGPIPGDGGNGAPATANPDVLCGSGGDAGDSERGGVEAAPRGPGLRLPAAAVAVAVAAAAAEAASPVPGGGGRRDAAATGEKSDRDTGLGERRGTPPPAGDLGVGGIRSCQTMERAAATSGEQVYSSHK